MGKLKGKRGRPSKLTPELRDTLCRAIESGLFLQEACAICGVAPATVYEWIARAEGRDDRKSTQEHAEFLDALRAAEATVVNKAVSAWVGHFDRDFRACESFLKRRFPFTWGDLVARSAPPPETEFDLDEPDVVDPELGDDEATEG